MRSLNSNLKNMAYFAIRNLLLPITDILDKFFNKLLYIISLYISFIFIIQKFKLIEFVLIDFSKQLNSFNNNDLYIILEFFIIVLLVKLIKNKIFINVNRYFN